MELQAAVSGELARALFALPERAKVKLGGERPPHARYLTPEMWLLGKLDGLAPEKEVPLEKGRAEFVEQCKHIADRVKLPVTSEDLTVGGVPARLYTPGGAPPAGPLMMFFHGGGWVVGSPDSSDRPCRWFAHLAGTRVLSVDYRMAPEHIAPAALEDCLAAYNAVAGDPATYGAQPGRISVGGDSAGGNLAALVSIEADPKPAFQVLIYPVTDLAKDHPSIDTFANGFLLTKARMEWFKDHYVPDRARRADPRISPLYADNLEGLPPAYVAVAIADPLLDEGVAYAKRLKEAGNHVVLQRHPLLHGFINLTSSRDCRDAVAQIAGSIRVLDTLSR